MTKTLQYILRILTHSCDNVMFLLFASRSTRGGATARDLVILQVTGSTEALTTVTTFEGARTCVQTHVHLETSFGRET